MRALAFLILLAACKQDPHSPKAWEQIITVYVPVDGIRYNSEVRKLAESGVKVTADSVKPHYVLQDDLLVVWRREEDIPRGTTYQEMSVRQAMETARKTGGPGGVCVAVGEQCVAKLSGSQAIDIAVAQNGMAPNSDFVLKRKP